MRGTIPSGRVVGGRESGRVRHNENITDALLLVCLLGVGNSDKRGGGGVKIHKNMMT